MSAPKHTPGPWKVNGLTIQHEEEGAIATVASFEEYDGNEADAHLIAAAPELLEALERLEEEVAALDLERSPALKAAWWKARAAIDKAEGR